VKPAGCHAFAGHAAALPLQASATSHTPAAGRQTVPAATYWQLDVQQAPPSHCSPASTVPFPQLARYVAMAAAHRRAGAIAPSAVNAPVEATIRYSGFIVTWLVLLPPVPVEARPSATQPAPAANVSLLRPSTPSAPIRSSAACVVAAVGPAAGVVLFPVWVAMRSRVAAGATPANSATLTARAAAVGCVTVIASPATSAIVTGAEHTTVRTPLVPAPLVTSASTP
jgi:hypothetical protein